MTNSVLMAAAILSLAIFARADTCNKDNCLNALASPSRSAATFCNSYTTAGLGMTNTVPIPTYVPTTCSPQRISSACYCVDNVGNPSYTPAACPTGQVVANPSFYGQAGSRSVDIRPWVIAAGAGAFCGVAHGYSIAGPGPGWGDPRSITCAFDQTLGGKSTVSQDLKLCPSTKYHLRMWAGHNYAYQYGEPKTYGNLTFRVLFGNTQILAPQKPSPRCWDKSKSDYVSDDSCQYNTYYDEYQATFIAPTSGKGALVVEVSQPPGLGGQEAPLLIDDIFVNPIGDDTTCDPAVKFSC